MIVQAWTAAGVTALVMGTTALVSRRVGRVAVVDLAWGLIFVVVALTMAVLWPDAHSTLVAVLVTLWGTRLAWHMLQRLRRDLGEDPRYEKMLQGARWWKVARSVFLLQAGVAFVISLPVQAAGAYDVRWWPVVVPGVLVWGVGMFFEVVGDAQLEAYRARPRAERPPILDTGLWAWTRHPNYFGDACVWWGIWLTAAVPLGLLPALVTVVSPVAMTYFVRNVTGARLLEQTMSTRPGWDDYAARVPLFFPRPPRP